MNHFVFKFFVGTCLVFFLAGCVFSWKPNVSDSSISVNDNTSMELTNEKEK